jgi:hypothetical protein
MDVRAMKENRTECRYAIETPCRVRFKELNKLVQVEGTIIEVSARGGRAHLPHEIPPKSVIVVDMDAAPGHHLFGHVVHCRRDGIPWSVGFKVVDNVLPFAIFRKLIAQGRVLFDTPTSAAQASTKKPTPPKPEKVVPPACYHLLDLPFPSTAEAIHLAFRRKAMKAHPDHGGDPADFIKLHQAMEEALRMTEASSSS